MAIKIFAVYICEGFHKTKYDVNKSPHKGWLVYKINSELGIDNEQYIDFIDESRHDSKFVKTKYPDVNIISGPCGSPIDATPKFFRKVKKLGVD